MFKLNNKDIKATSVPVVEFEQVNVYYEFSDH